MSDTQELQTLFNQYDEDKDGVLSKQDVKKLLKSIFEDEMPDDYIREMFNTAGVTDENKISFEQFQKMMIPKSDD